MSGPMSSQELVKAGADSAKLVKGFFPCSIPLYNLYKGFLTYREVLHKLLL